MSLRVRYMEAARKGDLQYLQTASPKPTQPQLNRALRIACEERRHDIVTFLVGQGARDLDGAILSSCRANDPDLLIFLFHQLMPPGGPGLSVALIYKAFNAACVNQSMEAAFVMASTGKIEWTYQKLSALSCMPLETARRVFKEHWLSAALNYLVHLDAWWTAGFFNLLQPHEFYAPNALVLRSTFSIMADYVISHRLDRYYRFKGYLIFYLPIPDLVTLCCEYF